MLLLGDVLVLAGPGHWLVGLLREHTFVHHHNAVKVTLLQHLMHFQQGLLVSLDQMFFVRGSLQSIQPYQLVFDPQLSVC